MERNAQTKGAWCARLRGTRRRSAQQRAHARARTRTSRLGLGHKQRQLFSPPFSEGAATPRPGSFRTSKQRKGKRDQDRGLEGSNSHAVNDWHASFALPEVLVLPRFPSPAADLEPSAPLRICRSRVDGEMAYPSL